VAAYKDENDAEGLKTVAGLREENRWLKAMVQWQAARIRVLEDVIKAKDPHFLESTRQELKPPPPSPG
jgi:hypothetical protein